MEASTINSVGNYRVVVLRVKEKEEIIRFWLGKKHCTSRNELIQSFLSTEVGLDQGTKGRSFSSFPRFWLTQQESPGGNHNTVESLEVRSLQTSL